MAPLFWYIRLFLYQPGIYHLSFVTQVGLNAPEYDEAPLNLVASHVAAEETHWLPRHSAGTDVTSHTRARDRTLKKRLQLCRTGF